MVRHRFVVWDKEDGFGTECAAVVNTPRDPWRLQAPEKPTECPACGVYAGHRSECPRRRGDPSARTAGIAAPMPAERRR
jgi:hypothetical protein